MNVNVYEDDCETFITQVKETSQMICNFCVIASYKWTHIFKLVFWSHAPFRIQFQVGKFPGFIKLRRKQISY